MPNKKKTNRAAAADEKFPLPEYKRQDDIYNREEEVPFEDEDQPTRKSSVIDSSPADDLDIPGTELDDADEAIGEEDEENNYYSLGGDNHDDLEEDRG